MLRIDLGCGANKQKGFIGVDRFPLPGVDAIADMNGCLPFAAGSVDLLFASHSLEHVNNLLATMQELYRICKHGSQLCVIAPYSEQKLNLANPYHKYVFNEHTPRFWTSYPEAPVDPEEFSHPQAPQWGLSRSDNSDPGIDFRLVRMEYFYFPQYAGLPVEEQRQLRRERVDVCDQIMYHLIVWKEPGAGPGETFEDCVAAFQPYEPEYMQGLRDRAMGRPACLEEQLRGRTLDAAATASNRRLEENRTELARLDAELRIRALESAVTVSGDNLEHARAEIARLESDLRTRTLDAAAAAAERNLEFQQRARLVADLECLTAELASLKKDHRRLESSEALLTGKLAAALEANRAETHAAALAQKELAGARDEIRELRSHLARLAAELAQLHEHSSRQSQVAAQLIAELDRATGQNRAIRDDAARSQREVAAARHESSLAQKDAGLARQQLDREVLAAAAANDRASTLALQNQTLLLAADSNDALQARLSLTQAELETTAALLSLQSQKEQSSSAAMREAQNSAAVLRAELERTQAEAERSRALLAAVKTSLDSLCAQTRFPSPAHLVRYAGFAIGRELPEHVHHARLTALRGYTDRQFQSTRALVVFSENLNSVPYREYIIPFRLDRLASVSVAFRPLMPPSSGTAGVEIVSESKILVHARLPLTSMVAGEPTEFRLPAPLTDLKKDWQLRIFVRDSAAPVALYELAQGSLRQPTVQFFPLVLFQ
jgi:Methyltransferase domain